MGFVYFIKESGFMRVKIGKAANRRKIDKRLSIFQTGNSRRLRLLGYIESEDYSSLEMRIHSVWESLKARGEWFRLTRDQAIDILKAYNGQILDDPQQRALNPISNECREACKKKVIGQERLSTRQLARIYGVKKWRIDQALKLYREEFSSSPNGHNLVEGG